MNKVKLKYIFEVVFFATAIAALLYYRYQVLINFGFEYTDSDQSLMWIGAIDFFHGNFYEPCYYGQSYNTMLESLLAAPLYAFGYPLNIALPTITSLLAIVPFLLLSILTFIYRSEMLGIVIIFFTFLLPAEYDFLTTLPRGFVTGIFMASPALIALFKPNNKFSFFICGLCAVLGYIANPNSVILSLPCLLFLFLNNYNNKHFYIYTAGSTLIGITVYVLMQLFYINNPSYNLHKYSLSFSSSYFWEGIKKFNELFNHIVPLFWTQGYLVLFIFILFFLYFYKTGFYKEAIVSVFSFLLILLTLCVSKVYDGTESVFFSYSRMYLAIPLVITVLISFIRSGWNSYAFLFIALSSYVGYNKLATIKDETEKCIKHPDHVVAITETKKLISDCESLNEIARKYNIGLIVISNHWFYDFYTYGCPACISDFPKTLRPSYERRTWRLLEDDRAVYNTILIIDLDRPLNKEFDFVNTISEKEGYYLIENNTIPTIPLLKELKIDVRNH